MRTVVLPRAPCILLGFPGLFLTIIMLLIHYLTFFKQQTRLTSLWSFWLDHVFQIQTMRASFYKDNILCWSVVAKQKTNFHVTIGDVLVLCDRDGGSLLLQTCGCTLCHSDTKSTLGNWHWHSFSVHVYWTNKKACLCVSPCDHVIISRSLPHLWSLRIFQVWQSLTSLLEIKYRPYRGIGMVRTTSK